jgi:hypothetical protein
MFSIHAVYFGTYVTAERDVWPMCCGRASEDHWTVSKPFARVQPATTKVLVRIDEAEQGVRDAGTGGQSSGDRGTRRGIRIKPSPAAPAAQLPANGTIRRKRSR